MMFSFKKYVFLSFAAILTLSAFAADEPTAQEFLERARNMSADKKNHTSPPATYGRFHGVLQHRKRKRGEDPLEMEMKVYFGIILQPEVGLALGQLVILDNMEGYQISQRAELGLAGIVLKPWEANTTEILDKVGVHAPDLTMSFLHYDLVKDEGSTTISAVASCRVLLLKAPNEVLLMKVPDDQKEKYARVYLEKEHAFPLRVEFLNDPNDKKPLRMMEVNGFTKKNDLYYARTIVIQGPGWRTKVDFDTKLAEIGLFDKDHPVNVFLYRDPAAKN